VFTGIIRGVGRIAEQTNIGGDRRVTIDSQVADLPSLDNGDSVAVNGVCLTVVATTAAGFSADVSLETLGVTTFSELSTNSDVNLEPALRVGDSLDGHLLTGHVDGVGRVLEVKESARSTTIRLEVAASLAPYIVRKGAIAVDGVSLTVNNVENTTFAVNFVVNIVPHTQKKTIILGYKTGTAVNIEVDIIARYFEQLAPSRDVSAGISLELLQKHGYTSTD
jgi:riboflavin synthase